MERDDEQSPPLVAAPRHLRRRRFRAEISDPLLAPHSEPYPLQPAEAAPNKSRAEKPSSPRNTTHRRKRLVAGTAVIIVSLSIIALIAALLLAS